MRRHKTADSSREVPPPRSSWTQEQRRLRREKVEAAEHPVGAASAPVGAASALVNHRNRIFWFRPNTNLRLLEITEYSAETEYSVTVYL